MIRSEVTVSSYGSTPCGMRVWPKSGAASGPDAGQLGEALIGRRGVSESASTALCEQVVDLLDQGVGELRVRDQVRRQPARDRLPQCGDPVDTGFDNLFRLP